ncbi:hypothetical protein Taro_015265, partial [Colocasia esculenta]|nr:hypothetical protein [Colocasia esculenta]
MPDWSFLPCRIHREEEGGLAGNVLVVRIGTSIMDGGDVVVVAGGGSVLSSLLRSRVWDSEPLPFYLSHRPEQASLLGQGGCRRPGPWDALSPVPENNAIAINVQESSIFSAAGDAHAYSWDVVCILPRQMQSLGNLMFMMVDYLVWMQFSLDVISFGLRKV